MLSASTKSVQRVRIAVRTDGLHKVCILVLFGFDSAYFKRINLSTGVTYLFDSVSCEQLKKSSMMEALLF